MGPHAVAEVDRRRHRVLERRRRPCVDRRVEHPGALQAVERRTAVGDRRQRRWRLRYQGRSGQGDRGATGGRQSGCGRVAGDRHRQLRHQRLCPLGPTARGAGQSARDGVGVPADRAVLERRHRPGPAHRHRIRGVRRVWTERAGGRAIEARHGDVARAELDLHAGQGELQVVEARRVRGVRPRAGQAVVGLGRRLSRGRPGRADGRAAGAAEHDHRGRNRCPTPMRVPGRRRSNDP